MQRNGFLFTVCVKYKTKKRLFQKEEVAFDYIY